MVPPVRVLAIKSSDFLFGETMSVQRILCYGDSNTFGQPAYKGVPTERYPKGSQWPQILQTQLGGQFEIIQEGLAGRTATDKAQKPAWNGRLGFDIALLSHKPIHHIVLALGENDLQGQYARTAKGVISDLLWYRKRAAEVAEHERFIIRSFVYVLIPNFVEKALDASDTVRQAVNQALIESGDPYVDPGAMKLSEDGVHFSPEDHAQLAQKVLNSFKERGIA